MSRRIVLFALAASATLIGSPVLADRECFENSCRLPGAVELPPQAESTPEPEASAAGEAAQPAAPLKAGAATAARPTAQARVLRKSSPAAIELRAETDAGEVAPADAVGTVPSLVAHGRSTAPAGGVMLAAPTLIYPGYASAAPYLLAPNAKIISIDAAD